MTSGARAPDAGSGTVWVLVLCMLIWFAAASAVLVGGVRADRHRAASAADLAALAAARDAPAGPGPACAAARTTAQANGADLVGCAVTALDASVTVSLPTRRWPAAVTARARAGPDATDWTEFG